MRMILEGTRVVDWTLFQVGPFASAMLADLGAEVIHVEERGVGDPIRGITSFLGMPITLPSGHHIHYEEQNRNKKSLAIDLGSSRGREVMYRLIEKSDVFLTNFRLAAVTKFGLNYKSLRQVNPRIIYASATGLGRRGPDAERPSLDLIALARSGIMLASGEEGMPPVMPTPGIGDRIAAMMLSYGIIAALLAREKYGIGQELAVSQLGSMMALQGYAITSILLSGRKYPRQSRSKAGNPLYNFYKCKDGKFIALAMLPEKHWTDFCRLVARPDLAEDPRFETAKKRQENCEALIALLDQMFATRPYEEWKEILGKSRDPIFTVVNSLSDLASDPQVVANNYITDFNHPALGPVKFVGFPVEFSETPATFRSPAPEFGQNTEEVLVDVCGYSWEDISRLRDEEVI